MSAAGLSTKNAPSPSVVVPHYIIGAIIFLIGSILMFFVADNLSSSFVGPKLLSLTHILVLGWVTIIIFGALYQLIPVVMEVKLFSEKLTYFSLWFLVIGTALMSWEFWFSYIGYSHIKYTGGSLIILSIIIFAYNVLKTAQKTTNKTIENRFIIISVFWLLITVFFGLFILFNSIYFWVPKSNIDLLKIHVLIGLVGWFMMLIIGVASTLMPMFFIAHQLNKKFLNIAFYTINSGLLFVAIGLYIDCHLLLYIAISGILFGMILFFRYNYDAYKKRLRKKLDIGMKLSVSAFIVFAISMISGILSLFINDISSAFSSKVYLIFGSSLILGFFTILILGQMYKTLPFIVWLQRYQDKVGKYKTPLPNDMYSEKIANAHYYTSLIALTTLIVGVLLSNIVLIKVSSVLYVITALLYLYNNIVIVLHKEKLEPIQKIDLNKKI